MGLGSSSVLNTIVHPDLHRALPRFYPSEVVVQRGTVVIRPNGEQVTTWADLLTDIRGNLAQRPGMERRGGELTNVPAGWSLNLDGYYPDIAKTDRVLVDGVAYNIGDVVHDSLSGSTRLDVERTAH